MTEIQMSEQLRELAASLMPKTRSPRYTYWRDKKGVMYCYTTEPMDSGKFVCWTYKPYGKGARNGKPTQWRAVNRVEFARRKVAKARAYARYEKAMESTRQDLEK